MRFSATSALALLGLVAVLAPASAYIIKKDFHPLRLTGKYGQHLTLTTTSFGFKKGGHMRLQVNCDVPTGPLSLLLMTETDYIQFTGGSVSSCSSTVDYAHMFVFANSTLNKPPKIDYKRPMGQSGFSGFYYFILRECTPIPAATLNSPGGTCDVVLTLLNPGGEHLSRDEIPLPRLYLVFTILWGSMLGLWLLNTLVFFKYSNNLHKVITILPVVKLLYMIMEYIRWSNSSETGRYSDTVETTRHIALDVENAAMFVVFMLISDGWCIVSTKMEACDLFNIVGLPIIFFLSSLGERYVHEYFLGLSILAIIFMVVYVIRKSGANILFLQSRYAQIKQLFREQQANEQVGLSVKQFSAPIRGKKQLLEASRLAFCWYAVLWIILAIASTFLEEYTWIEVLCWELLELVVYVPILAFFRLRSFKRYYPPEPRDEKKDIEVTLFTDTDDQPLAVLVPLDGSLFQDFLATSRRDYHRRQSMAGINNGDGPVVAEPRLEAIAEDEEDDVRHEGNNGIELVEIVAGVPDDHRLQHGDDDNGREQQQ